MQRLILCLLLILLIPLAQAAELKISASLDPLYTVGELVPLNPVIENTADSPLAAELSIKFKAKREKWELIEELDCGGRVELMPFESKEILCSYPLQTFLEPGEYKFYLRADIEGGTYTYKDLIFEIGEPEEVLGAAPKKEKEYYEPLEKESEFPFLFSGATLFIGLLIGLFVARLKH
jgi:hypothetical protein